MSYKEKYIGRLIEFVNINPDDYVCASNLDGIEIRLREGMKAKITNYERGFYLARILNGKNKNEVIDIAPYFIEEPSKYSLSKNKLHVCSELETKVEEFINEL